MAAMKVATICYVSCLLFFQVCYGQEREFPLLMPHVHPEHAESYMCTPIRIDEEKDFFITGFRPNASQETAHHMLIFGCADPGSEEPVWSCSEMSMENHNSLPCKSNPQILYAWAKDAPELKLPKDVGFRYG